MELSNGVITLLCLVCRLKDLQGIPFPSSEQCLSAELSQGKIQHNGGEKQYAKEIRIQNQSTRTDHMLHQVFLNSWVRDS